MLPHISKILPYKLSFVKCYKNTPLIILFDIQILLCYDHIMKNVYILFFSLFLLSCGGEIELYDCDFITNQNVCVFFNGFNINSVEVESIIQYTIDRSVEAFGHEKEIKNIYNEIPITLTWIDEPNKWMIDNDATAYNRLHFNNNCSEIKSSTIIIDYYPFHSTLLECSPLAHEMLHLHQAIIDGEKECEKDYLPHPPEWFGIDGLEYKIYNKLNNVCNVLYT